MVKGKWKTQKEYKEAISHCPHCDSGDVTTEPPEVNDGEITQEMQCDDCRARWMDIYKFVRYMKN